MRLGHLSWNNSGGSATLSAAVFNGIIHHADNTLIITQERDFAKFVAIVPKGLLHPKQLHATMACSNILGFGGRKSY